MLAAHSWHVFVSLAIKEGLLLLDGTVDCRLDFVWVDLVWPLPCYVSFSFFFPLVMSHSKVTFRRKLRAPIPRKACDKFMLRRHGVITMASQSSVCRRTGLPQRQVVRSCVAIPTEHPPCVNSRNPNRHHFTSAFFFF